MQRTNIYLADSQLAGLRQLARRTGRPVAELVREAVSDWLGTQGVEVLSENDWTARFDALIDRRRALAGRRRFEEGEVAASVAAATREVRAARSADGAARRR